MEPPFVDEHQVVVAASPAVVWQSLVARLAGIRLAAPYAALVGTEPRRASGVPPAEGATLPGFAVTAAVPERRLELTGRHRFSHYRWEWTLTPSGDSTRLTATTYAAFPGFFGGAYRLLVISSHAHQVLVRRMLRSVARHAVRQSR